MATQSRAIAGPTKSNSPNTQGNHRQPTNSPRPSSASVNASPALSPPPAQYLDRTEHAIRKMAQMGKLLVFRDEARISFDHVDLGERIRIRKYADG